MKNAILQIFVWALVGVGAAQLAFTALRYFFGLPVLC